MQKYICRHIPTGEIFFGTIKPEDKFLTQKEFYQKISKWNQQDPENWAYCPINNEEVNINLN